MKSTSLSDVKKELQVLNPEELRELCLSLAKYKKDNKEFIGYKLFESHSVEGFIVKVKALIDEHFSEIDTQKNLYYIKKGLRKLLRILNTYCRYIDEYTAKADILIYFCIKLKGSGIPYHKSVALENLFLAQIKKIETAISFLHEDIQNDYLNDLNKLKG